MDISATTRQAFWRGVKTAATTSISGYGVAIVAAGTFMLPEIIWVQIVETTIAATLGMAGLKLKDGAKY
jgi:hypothetical protein